MEHLNKRFLEVFRDMQRLKLALLYYAKRENPKIAREALEDTKTTFDWQYRFKRERGLEFNEDN